MAAVMLSWAVTHSMIEFCAFITQSDPIASERLFPVDILVSQKILEMFLYYKPEVPFWQKESSTILQGINEENYFVAVANQQSKIRKASAPLL